MTASQGEHARCPLGTMINGRYNVLREVGCGNFSKVYCCADTKNDNTQVAVKLLKKEYTNDAKFEHNVLKALTNKDKDRNEKVLTMNEHFTWNRHPCFVFPLKGNTLRSRKFGVRRGSCTRDEFRKFAMEMLQALKFLHFDMKLVHTDLKPENILLDALECSASSLGNGWTIADFGSASFYRLDKKDKDLISTRPYRAPEVVTGQPWSYPADMWSMGCILFEVYHGSKLFDVHDDHTHVAQMEARLGKLPKTITQYSSKLFDVKGNINQVVRLLPSSATPICETLKDEPLLLDLIQSMLHYDATKRVRADEAIAHPFFDEVVGKREPPRARSEELLTFTRSPVLLKPLPELLHVTEQLRRAPQSPVVAQKVQLSQHSAASNVLRSPSLTASRTQSPLILPQQAAENATKNVFRRIPTGPAAGKASGLVYGVR